MPIDNFTIERLDSTHQTHQKQSIHPANTNNKRHIKLDKIPYSFSTIKQTMKQVMPNRPLLSLFDSGSTLTWIKKTCMPTNTNFHINTTPIIGATMAGTFRSDKSVTLFDVTLPEFSPTRKLTKLVARVMETDCRYDIIYG